MQKAALSGGCGSALPLLFILIAQSVSAQTTVGQAPQSDKPATDEGTISVDVNLVVLHATVRDRQGGFVSGLDKKDFRVFDDGAPQSIKLFEHEDVPVAVGLIVDNSGSMRRKKPEVTSAAQAFVRASNPHDEMFVVNFNEKVSFGLPDTQLFSASPAELERALNGVPAQGETALYDAIQAGLDHLTKATIDKKVLIVISDGGDNRSRRTLDQVLETAGRSDVIVYTVGLFDEEDEDRNPGVLRRIARATGGEVYLPTETSQVVPICERIAEDIRNQYTIGYAPAQPKSDNAYRAVKVIATGTHGEKLVVRTRTGYIAAGQPLSSANRASHN